MAQFIVRNMIYVTGAGRSRIPRQPAASGSNPAGMTQVGADNVVTPNAPPGTHFNSIPAQPTQIVSGITYYYAFTSFSGGVEGGAVTNDIGAQVSETVNPASSDVIQINVYVPHGGGPGNGSAALIDAFDVTTGGFVDDMFVTVSNNALTHDANYLGVVNSTNAPVVVSAYNWITPTNANFTQWLIMPGTASGGDSPSGNNLNVSQGSNMVAFAYYKAPDPGGKQPFKEFKDYKDHHERQYKNQIPEIYKSLKEAVEISGPETVVDPADYVRQVQAINTKLNSLESKLTELGKSFTAKNKADVGKAVAAKANKRK